jgi:hypothetical protein
MVETSRQGMCLLEKSPMTPYLGKQFPADHTYLAYHFWLTVL